jgi:hypothetical protein
MRQLIAPGSAVCHRWERRYTARSAPGRCAAIGIGLSGAILALAATPAPAQQWQARTVANVELGYDDNVRLTIDDPEGSVTSSLNAAAHAVRLTENSTLDLAAGLSLNRYGSATDLNYPAVFLGADSRYRGERSQYRLAVSLDTQSTLTSEAATSGLTQLNKQQYQFVVTPGWSYALTERASMDLGLSYTDVFYEDVKNTPLYNYQLGTLSLGGGYQLSERGGLDVRVDYGRYKADQIDNEYDNISAQLGANYLLTETWSLNFLYGLRRTESRFSDLAGQRVTQSSTGPTYVLSLGKRFDRGGGLDFQAVRELAPSGTAQVLDTTSIAFRLNYPFTERWRLGFDTTGYRNQQPSGEVSLSDRKYVDAGLRLTYALGQAWTLGANYRYRWQNRDEVPGNAQSNAVFLTLAWNKNWMP